MRVSRTKTNLKQLTVYIQGILGLLLMCAVCTFWADIDQEEKFECQVGRMKVWSESEEEWGRDGWGEI